jgi:molecular chaperone GrpE
MTNTEREPAPGGITPEPLTLALGTGAEPEVPDGTGAPAGPAPAAADAPADLRRERDELRDQLLRRAAEFDNYRKRVERERRELADFAAADLIKELLPLVDNLERASKADAGAASVESLRKGVELIHRQLLDVLARRGVAVIDPIGADFDPHWHEAVVREAAPDRRDGEVLDVFSPGYTLGGRLLRPAMVKVASA